MYNQSAEFYDAIYRLKKDYADEAKRLDYLLKQLTPTPQSILDVACGTGEHARHLSQSHGYHVDGIDVQPKFIDIAAAKNPDGIFTIADMAQFDLGKTYDAIVCLFTSIGYAETVDRMQQAIDSMSKHLLPGGYIVLEPWAEPDSEFSAVNDFTEDTDPDTGLHVTRSRSHRVEHRVSVMEIEYTVDLKGSLTHQFSETHRIGLFSKEEIMGAFHLAGLNATYAPQGLHANGIYLAKKATKP